MDSPIIGTIFWFAGSFAPRNFLTCSGQVLSIASNAALFSIIGTYYGGNGTTTFQLPNLIGSAPIGAGYGPSLSGYVQGQVGGSTTGTVLSSNLPAHTHMLGAVTTGAGKPHPGPQHSFSTAASNSYIAAAPDTTLDPLTLSPSGLTQPFPLVKPYLTLTACIAVVGVFPSRN
jgi:microcystin-dependent protein